MLRLPADHGMTCAIGLSSRTKENKEEKEAKKALPPRSPVFSGKAVFRELPVLLVETVSVATAPVFSFLFSSLFLRRTRMRPAALVNRFVRVRRFNTAPPPNAPKMDEARIRELERKLEEKQNRTSGLVNFLGALGAVVLGAAFVD